MGDLKSENPGVPGGGGFTILKTPGTPGVGDWDYRGVSQTLSIPKYRADLKINKYVGNSRKKEWGCEDKDVK